ncbi:unnamed protein product [Brassica rapa subsp. trilocularis]
MIVQGIAEKRCRSWLQVVMVQVLGFANLLSRSRWECQYTVDRSFQLA